MDFDFDPLVAGFFGSVLVLGLVLLWIRQGRNRALKAFRAEGESGADNDDPASADDGRSAKNARRTTTPGKDGCPHHYVITGFPADRVGTHLNLTCEKCGARQTVTIAESRTLLDQRDDLRAALSRARGRS